MGKLFGNLAVIRGILYYTISPHEQRAYAGVIKNGLPNLVPRVFASMWTYMPVFLLSYGIYVGVEDAHRRSKRKNPKDFLNEVDPNPPPTPPPSTATDAPLPKCVKMNKQASIID